VKLLKVIQVHFQDVDGSGSEAVGTGGRPWSEILHHTSLPCQFLFLGIHFLVRRKDSTAQNGITAKFSRI
jgi:hypothetical protein